ncbi:MAG: serine/threonine-protein kinase [Polyangiaceae bacterium]
MPPSESTAPRPSRPPQPGLVVAGRYRLESQIGEGGMGSVWRAEDQDLGRTVAIKFMSADGARSKGLRARFAREARAAAKLRTRHVVAIHDFGVDGTLPYIVMEHLEGEDLRRRLRRLGRLSGGELIGIIMQVARALSRSERAGIVHRDLKPANIFLARIDDEEVVKVLDFGVAKETRQTHPDAAPTKSGVVLGSPPYMSPEQARGRNLDHRSDVWSLGAIAYRALSGKVPFSGDSDGDVIVKLCTEAPPPPSTHLPTLSPEVDALFARAFARDPDDRFQSAPEFARALAKALGEERLSLVLDEPSMLSTSGDSMGEPLTPSGEEVAKSESSPRRLASHTEEVATASNTAEENPAEDNTVESKTTPMQPAEVTGETRATWASDEIAIPRRRYKVVAAVALVLVGGLLYLLTRSPQAPTTLEGGIVAAPAPTRTVEPAPPPAPTITTTPSASSPPSASASSNPSSEPSSEPISEPSSKPSGQLSATSRPKAPKPSASPRVPPPPPPATPAPKASANPWGY